MLPLPSSTMDPLSAIGLAAAVVQFIEFGVRVASRLEEFNSTNPGEVPRSLQAISTQLPLLLNALSRIKSDAEIKNLDFDTKCILRGIVSGCILQITEVERMVNEITRTPGDSFKVKIKKVFVSLKYDEKVWEIERTLHTYISVLILHHVIDTSEAPLELAEDTFFDVREKRISAFVERPVLMKELDDSLRDAAWSQAKNPTILVLAGDKGVGKTQLAVEYCHQAHTIGQFKTVFWLDASSLELLSLGFESIYATIKRSTDGSKTEKIAFVTGFLNNLWHPWLLVLDNYNASELYNDIMEFLPTRGSGGIILISRLYDQNGLASKILQVPKFIPREDQIRLNNLLTQEVQKKDIDGIKNLVDLGADVNSLIWNEWPCLHRAALFGLEDTVAFLLARGADMNPPIQIRKPIYWAASSGHEAVCRLLLDHEDKTGEYSNPTDYQSAFNAAAAEGNFAIAKVICSRRQVGFNSKNQYDQTPLQSAAGKGHVEVLKFLIEQGALADDYSQGREALTSAASSGQFEIVKLLCIEGKVDPNVQDGQGNTPLCLAARLKNDTTYEETGVEMTRFLLDQGADPNSFGKSTDGPIHAAAVHNHVKTMRLLLDHGADPTKDANGWSPLTNAIKYNSPEALATLLSTPISDAEARKTSLENALRYAARSGNRSAVLEILKAGADINAISTSGSPKLASPLFLAVINGEIKTAQFLIRQGARQDLADADGRLPLPIAAQNGYETLVRDLIKADPKMVDVKSGENEDTPLILAAGKGHEKVVRVLLQNGADQMLGNKFGDIALDVAEEHGFEKVIEALEGLKL